MNRKRIMYLIALIIFFLIELFIALYVRDRFIRPYVGDMLVVILVYCLVRIFIPEKYPLMPLYVFLFACVIEGLQYFELVKVLGLEQNRLIRTVLGTVFDWKDIMCYGAGCIVLALYEWFYRSRIEVEDGSRSK